MFILIYQIIGISIIYFKYEKVIKIDIKRYYEDFSIPAISIGFDAYQIKNPYLKKCFVTKRADAIDK